MRARPRTPPTTLPAMAPTFVDLYFWVSPPVLPPEITVVVALEVVLAYPVGKVVLVYPAGVVLTYPVRVVGPRAVALDSGPAGTRIGLEVLLVNT